jgi:hypothetical protein
MKKSPFLLSGILVTSLLMCLSQPADAAGKEKKTPQVEGTSISQPVVTKAKKPKNSNKKNNTLSDKAKSSAGRCNKPDDLDAKGNRCGNRASSVKKGGR